MKKTGTLRAIALLAVAATGCTASKSSSPLSPTVAGPLPGVEITAPKALEPAANIKIPVEAQPLTLLLESGGSNGPRPLSYVFEVAVDSAFSSKIFVAENVPPGEGGRTSVRLTDHLAPEHSYFWRARAQDGANVGPYSAPASFDVFTRIVIEAPDLIAPGVNVDGQPLRPTFVVKNAVHSGPVGSLSYIFEIGTSDAFASKAFVTVPEGPNPTSVISPQDLGYSTVYYWHVRAFDAKTLGPWSVTRAFQTVPQPIAAPAPPPANGGGSGNWEQCGSTAGQALSECVVAAVRPAHTVAGAFEVTKRIAWLLRGSGGGLLIKNGGENIVLWKGFSFAAARISFRDGHIWKVLSDVPTTNGPSWQDNDFVDRSLYVPAIDPR